MKSLIAVLLVLAFAATAIAQEKPVGQILVQSALAESDPAKRKEIGETILELGGTAGQYAGWFAEGRDYGSKVPTGWLEKSVVGSDGVSRAYLLYVPADYDPAKKYLMFVDMHGGIGRPQALTHAELQQMKYFWGNDAELDGFFLALPTGQTGAEWWTEVGSGNVLWIVSDTKRFYNIDEDRVIATGFSDGGSGSFYLAMTHPTPFAAFLPLSGHVGVAGIGGLQIHLQNLLNRPLYITNTDRDSLYPSAGVKPYIDGMKSLGVPLIWRDIKGFTHNPTYLADERPRIKEWVANQRRIPHPKRAVWAGTAKSPSRVDWLVVDEIGETDAGPAKFEDPNPMIRSSRLLLGVSIDREFTGKGVKVTTVSDGSPAEAAGVEPGDVIVAMDETEIEGFQDLRGALGKKKFGDRFELILKRGEESKIVEGKFPEPTARPAFVRREPFGIIDISRDGQTFTAKTSRIRKFTLLLSEDAIDLSKPVKVVVDGRTLHDGVVQPDLRLLVTQALADEDRRLVYSAGLTVTVPAPKK